jgi:hypothetical protein
MRKLAAPVSFVLLSALGGCSTYDPNWTQNPPNPDPLPVTQSAPMVASGPTVPYRAGYGRIEAVATVPIAPSRSAASGGTVGYVYGPAAYQLTVRMDDGSAQTIIQDNPSFRVGDRVQLTNDGRVIRL